MAWSSTFIADLANPALTPMWRLDRVLVGTASGLAWSCYSHGGSPRIRRVRIEGQTLNEYTGAVTWGRTLIEVVGDDLGTLADCVPRGTFMALYLGFPGYAAGDYQRVAWGQIRQVRGRRPTWTIELIDAPTGLRQRSVNAVGEIELCHDIDPDEYTTLDADYTPGDASITVDSTTGFVRPTGENGAVLITPTSGDPFYLTWSANTGTTFTVGTSSVMGTTQVAAVVGDRVSRVAYFNDHPIANALKILTSGFAGANGPFDVLPVSWGLQVPSGFVDITDALFYKDSVATTGGAYSWQHTLLASQPDGLAWMTTELAAGGFYLAMRQGSITVRAIQQTIAPIAYYGEWAITDSDIVEVTSHEWWSPDTQEECASVAAITAGASTSVTTTMVYQRPAAVVASYDVSEKVWANQAAIRTEMTNRLTECKTTTPEKLTVRLRGWWWGQMCCGDLARITTARVHSRLSGPDGFNGMRCKVVQVSPSWDGPPVTDVTVLVYPVRGTTWA